MTNDYDLIVVGGGVFGSVIARTCKQQGLSVIVIDDQRPMSGSKASGFMINPAWVPLETKERDDCFALLDRLYGLDEMRLRLKPTKKVVYVKQVDRLSVLEDPNLCYLQATVKTVVPNVVHLTNGHSITAKYIVVAAGIWSSELTPVPGLIGKRGVSFLFKGSLGRDTIGFIRNWAPYKQIVAHKSHLPDRYWVGDGTAILDKNWNREVQEQVITRVCKVVRQPIKDAILQHGIRPYINGVRPCYYKKQDPDNIWVVTAGAKNGTIGSAFAALRFIHEIGIA